MSFGFYMHLIDHHIDDNLILRLILRRFRPLTLHRFRPLTLHRSRPLTLRRSRPLTLRLTLRRLFLITLLRATLLARLRELLFLAHFNLPSVMSYFILQIFLLLFCLNVL